MLFSNIAQISVLSNVLCAFIFMHLIDLLRECLTLLLWIPNPAFWPSLFIWLQGLTLLLLCLSVVLIKFASLSVTKNV